MELNLGKNDCEVRARVSRIWAVNIYDKKSGRHDEFIGYDILLIDDEGTQILASIGKRIVGKFLNHLFEGSIYSIKVFELRQAKPHYKVVDNEFVIHFLQTTVVSPTFPDGFTGPLHKFSLVPYTQLSARMGSITHLTDIVGRLVSSTKVDMVGLGKTLKRRILHLEDSNNEKIYIALLGDRADLISDSDFVGTPPVLVVTSTLIKSYNGSISICSTTATCLLRNPVLPETVLFAQGSPVAARSAELVARPARQLTYAVLVERKKNLIELIAYCDDPKQREAVFYAHARVTRIILDHGWCYPSCDSHN